MTVTYVVGDLLASGSPAIGHGVNCKGVMGAGIAPLIRDMYPARMYGEYQVQCAMGILKPGGVHVYDGRLFGLPMLFNLASQNEPGPDASEGWLSSSLLRATMIARAYDIKEIAMPRIGCGIGGLDWESVKELLEVISSISEGIDLKVYSLA